ncbi:hypothetical protein EYF80_009194 [Liparis tanakae]|uniref:Uncharacterized protein n=1 Tax=Liparis tanakae TaxID=230148 RepID=A0A4Z2IR98_9TELE|nr:hypothetical protein EYF80_009194 [Liparis tanakae]
MAVAEAQIAILEVIVAAPFLQAVILRGIQDYLLDPPQGPQTLSDQGPQTLRDQGPQTLRVSLRFKHF